MIEISKIFEPIFSELAIKRRVFDELEELDTTDVLRKLDEIRVMAIIPQNDYLFLGSVVSMDPNNKVMSRVLKKAVSENAITLPNLYGRRDKTKPEILKSAIDDITHQYEEQTKKGKYNIELKTDIVIWNYLWKLYCIQATAPVSHPGLGKIYTSTFRLVEPTMKNIHRSLS